MEYSSNRHKNRQNVRIALSLATMLATATAYAQDTAATVVDTLKSQKLNTLTVVSRRSKFRSPSALNATTMLRDELFKAACCNLGESFVNNPSVDVSYSDAATGARQIRLLGLSGRYVQMLTENLPDFRGAALPYALSYVPGSWMKSIQVSTGNASVKNGYEAMTGQINVEYLKPEDDQGLSINLYGNTMSRFEADVDGNVHLKKDLSTEILAHFENNWGHHDGNGDGFQDMPNIRQYNFQNRWYWKTGHYMFHGGVTLLKEDRGTGQANHNASPVPSEGGETNNSPLDIAPTSQFTFSPPSEGKGEALWRSTLSTNRYSAYMKHAYIFGDSHNTNIAFMGNMSMHELDANYGLKHYDVNEKTAYASLMLESDITPKNNISVGLSYNYDYLKEHVASPVPSEGGEMNNSSEDVIPHKSIYPLPSFGGAGGGSEGVFGGYAQYTYNHSGKVIAMAGLRVDHSNKYGTFWTPRFHLKWTATDWMTLRASAGLGYRTPMAMAEYNYLMASGRQLVIADHLSQEKAWNYGLTANFYIPISSKTLTLNAQYYYTRFSNETVVDYDSDPTKITIADLDGLSYSHTFQVDASMTVIHGLDLNAAYRYNLVKSTYGGNRMSKPLQSRYKALFSASYKPGMGLWQFDVTLAINGGGRVPQGESFSAYPTLNAQIKRSFRHFEIYMGGENLTGYKQKNPIRGADAPWDKDFDPTLVYGPVTGAMGYVGVRIKLGHHY